MGIPLPRIPGLHHHNHYCHVWVPPALATRPKMSQGALQQAGRGSDKLPTSSVLCFPGSGKRGHRVGRVRGVGGLKHALSLSRAIYFKSLYSINHQTRACWRTEGGESGGFQTAERIKSLECKTLLDPWATFTKPHPISVPYGS